MRIVFACITACCLLLIPACWAGAAGYDSNGFEAPTFTPGPLVPQDGWTGGSDGGGIDPEVVTAPHPVIGQQAVKLEVPDIQGAHSWMDHAIDPVVAVPGTIVTVTYDIYRPVLQGTHVQNLWWWWWDAGEPTYGLQWDQAGTTPLTLPHGWNPGAGSIPTVMGAWANVTMVWDFTDMKAYSWYGGTLVDNGIPITNITQLTGWTIYLGHDADTGTGAALAYIDNFKISISVVPDPSSLLAMAAGLAGMAGCALRRRS